MGVQREPGQKGVNWSNIAVGRFHGGYSCDTISTDVRGCRGYNEHGMHRPAIGNWDISNFNIDAALSDSLCVCSAFIWWL